MKRPISLRIDEELFCKLFAHLFPGDGDEHGAVIAAGMVESSRGTRLLAREVFLAREGIDYVPGSRGYRALTARFVAEKVEYCASQCLCYLAVHCHGGTDRVGFSRDDIDSHERGYPALLEITKGGPVGALVFARNAVAGDIWTPGGRLELDDLTVIGPRYRKLYPEPPAGRVDVDPIFDRHARLFGDVGQRIFSDLKVGIIGLGGGGSLVNEWLARLGVGHIVGVDFDRVEPSNLPRVVGATRWDAAVPLTTSRWPWLRRVGTRLARHKVHVARRVARCASPRIRYDAVVGNVLDEPVAKLLKDADFVFLAGDTIQSRRVFNALVHQYLVPGIQIGAKVPVDRMTRQVGAIFTATRPVLPGPGRGCLLCHELIPPARLNEEALTESERRAQRYVDDDNVAEPSVIALNVLSASQAINDFMMMFTGLYGDTVLLSHQLHFVRNRELNRIEAMRNLDCLDCSDLGRSRRARGESVRLPCRSKPTG